MQESGIVRIEALSASDLRGMSDDRIQAPLVVLPGNNTVHSLESHLKAPLRQRVQYGTERLKDFCRYVKAESVDGETAVFVEPDGSGAVAVIDFGNAQSPLWKQHRATLRMKYTPEFQAVMELCRRPMDQRELTNFIEDWQHVLTAEAEGENLSLAEAIKAIRAVTISNIREATNEVADFEAASSALSRISAKSKAGTLPSKLVMNCRVYQYTQEFAVRCRLSILTGNDTPTFKARIIGLEKMQQDVAEEVELEIAAALSGTAKVFVGSLD